MLEIGDDVRRFQLAVNTEVILNVAESLTPFGSWNVGERNLLRYLARLTRLSC
jgi:hypothetical protein